MLAPASKRERRRAGIEAASPSSTQTKAVGNDLEQKATSASLACEERTMEDTCIEEAPSEANSDSDVNKYAAVMEVVSSFNKGKLEYASRVATTTTLGFMTPAYIDISLSFKMTTNKA